MQAAFMDMRLPTPSKWVPSDARAERTREEGRLIVRALYARLKALNGLQRGGRMSAAAIRDALQSDDRYLPDYLRRMSAKGYLKRERILNHFCYSLADPTPAQRARARAKAKQARIVELRRAKAKLERTLKRMGC